MRGKAAKRLRKIAIRSAQNQPWVEYQVKKFKKNMMTHMGMIPWPVCSIAMTETCQRRRYKMLKKAWKGSHAESLR